MKNIILNQSPTELYKILKFEGLAASGGEAKAMIADGQVTLNGKVETRKRKKIIAGDVISFAGETFKIKLGLIKFG